jgi:uncharacterized protein DUF4286
MICYNITLTIDPAIETEWLQWQNEEHIPEVMSTGLFTEYKFFKLLEQDESEGITYVVQYFSSSIENYNHYISQYATKLREKAFAKWKDRFIAFRTVMKLVN